MSKKRNSPFPGSKKNKLNDQAKNLIEVIKKISSLLILIKGSPDPDALASSFALHFLCQKLNISSRIIASQKPSLFQNREFIRLLDIPVKFSPDSIDPDKFDAYAVLDHQSSLHNLKNFPLPCAVHIDHHEPVTEANSCDFRLVMPESGSSSTIMALLIKELNYDDEFKKEDFTKVATALIFGIQTDTNKYDFAGKLDYSALAYLSKYADTKLLNRISGIPLSEETVKLLGIAIENEILYKDWLISQVGFLEEIRRDNIAIIADFLLKREKVNTVIVFAIIEGEKNKRLYLDASLRSIDDKLDLNAFIKKITTDGGARKRKGAYQIHLDYFQHCPDKTKLWELVYQTTMEVLKKSRDNLIKIEIESLFARIKKKFLD